MLTIYCFHILLIVSLSCDHSVTFNGSHYIKGLVKPQLPTVCIVLQQSWTQCGGELSKLLFLKCSSSHDDIYL